MNQEGVDLRRRRFLTGATGVVGGAGAAFLAVPFLEYWQPSARAEAAGAPVEQDVSQLQRGQLINIEWRGRPVWVFRRNENDIETLKEMGEQLRDPQSKVESQQPPYAQNPTRSIIPQIGVLVGICTHLGCSPVYHPERGGIGSDWPGGFFCPCHGSKFDLAGRVYTGVPAPTNLVVPPYWFPQEGRLIVGEHQEGGAA